MQARASACVCFAAHGLTQQVRRVQEEPHSLMRSSFERLTRWLGGGQARARFAPKRVKSASSRRQPQNASYPRLSPSEHYLVMSTSLSLRNTVDNIPDAELALPSTAARLDADHVQSHLRDEFVLPTNRAINATARMNDQGALAFSECCAAKMMSEQRPQLMSRASTCAATRWVACLSGRRRWSWRNSVYGVLSMINQLHCSLVCL